METECVNLRERFGRQYRVVYEESYYAARTRNTIDDPWLQIIPCRHGHVFPHGGTTLAAATNTRGGTARKLAALDFATVHQDGSDGVTVLFPVERFAEISEIMRPLRRRRLSPEARRLAGVRLARYQFGHVVESPQTIAVSTQGTQDGVLAVLPARRELKAG